ncbi:XdhC family protein [Paeniglutamicibacter sp. R2-26]|uniref:XdhC family protein n=1 Tax=Paeniglutamicibacter sp. R2-26 TaxID=3144417 RepID=UPI003EE78B6D
MLNLHSGLDTARVATGGSFAVATIVGTTGSTPHPIGTSMLVHADGSTTSSLSGGCIEGAVHAAALEALEDGTPRREHYGYSPADAFAVGLTCGGEIDVHITPCAPQSSMHDVLDHLAAFNATDPVALIRRIDAGSSGSVLVPHPGQLGIQDLAGLLVPLVGPGASSLAATLCFQLVAGGRTGIVGLENEGASCAGTAIELLVESRLSPPRLVVFGANTFAEELLKLAPMLGYRSTLCDARAAFTLQPRFNTADQVSTLWPHEYLAGEIAAGRIDARTVLCVLTHDPKFDVPLLSLALRHPVAYLGAMGSRSSHEARMEALRAERVPEPELARLHSPIGLDLQAASAAEVAISIAAEIIAARSAHATAAPLNTRSGSIHTRTAPEAAAGNPHHTTTQEEPAWT